MRKKVKIVKWAIGIIALSIIFIGFLQKVFQVLYLKTINWDISSFSPFYIISGLILSLAFVAMAFLERLIHPDSKLRKPEQIVVLVLGLSGLIYSGILMTLWVKDYAGGLGV